MVKCKFINIHSIKEKKSKKYRALKPFYESGLQLLESVGGLDGKSSKTSRISLAYGTHCVGYGEDLGEKEAQLVPSNMSELRGEDYMMARVPDTPCVLDISHIASNTVTCGHQKACEDRAKDLYQPLILKESRALMVVPPDTKICHGPRLFPLLHEDSQMLQVPCGSLLLQGLFQPGLEAAQDQVQGLDQAQDPGALRQREVGCEGQADPSQRLFQATLPLRPSPEFCSSCCC